MLQGGARPATAHGHEAIAGRRASDPELGSLEALLAAGGDGRLALAPATRLNGYGCRPYPRPEAFTFASSTATSISERAYAAAGAALAGLRRGLPLLTAVDRLRADLLAELGLADLGAQLVLSPSGTDSQLQALLVARTLLGTPLTSVVVAADETGSGTFFAAVGQHFSGLTARGLAVAKGEPVAGLGESVDAVPVPLRDAAGGLRPAAETDAAVTAAVERALAAGRRVLLHAMDQSKLGTGAPSAACLARLQQCAGDRLLVLLDAAQLRLGRAALRAHLGAGHLVLVTGSKFFTGPPFSGGLLVPAEAAARLAACAGAAPGLADYSWAGDWPAGWAGIRGGLPADGNPGQYLRWVAALAEMRAFWAVPAAFRRDALRRFAATLPALLAADPVCRLLPEAAAPPPAAPGDEMQTRTIFPFLLERDGRPLAVEACGAIYRALNQDVAPLLPAAASAAERRLAAQLCHIGQPVALRHASGATVGALRISAGARYVSGSWRPEPAAAEAALAAELDQVRTILAKIGLLVRHLDAVTGPL
jgi:hypothetical protein